MRWVEFPSQPANKHSIPQCQFTSAGIQSGSKGLSLLTKVVKFQTASGRSHLCQMRPRIYKDNVLRGLHFSPCIFLCLCVYADHDSVRAYFRSNLSLPFTLLSYSLDSWFRFSASHHSWMKTLLCQLPYLRLPPCCKVLPVDFPWKVYISISALMLLLLSSPLICILFLLIVAYAFALLASPTHSTSEDFWGPALWWEFGDCASVAWTPSISFQIIL